MSGAQSAQVPPSGCPVAHKSKPSGDMAAAAATGCPVAQGSKGSVASTAAFAEAAATNSSSAKSHASGCPVGHNPANNELPANQRPAAGQKYTLPTDRVTSSIPSGDPATSSAEPLWTYPSEQQFYNAMKRKGYSPNEQEMNAVVAIHNAVNERAWAEVCHTAHQHTCTRCFSNPPLLPTRLLTLRAFCRLLTDVDTIYICSSSSSSKIQVVTWEQTLHPECTDSMRLVRFQGKPDEPTPKARLNTLLGYRAPFDRHDWVITRCGKEVTYLLDFYHGRATPGKPVAMHIDARPAATDADGIWDRMRMPFVRMWQSANAPAP